MNKYASASPSVVVQIKPMFYHNAAQWQNLYDPCTALLYTTPMTSSAMHYTPCTTLLSTTPMHCTAVHYNMRIITHSGTHTHSKSNQPQNNTGVRPPSPSTPTLPTSPYVLECPNPLRFTHEAHHRMRSETCINNMPSRVCGIRNKPPRTKGCHQ